MPFPPPIDSLDMIYPEALRPGDLIAIVSPATTIKPQYISGAREALVRAGFRVTVAPHALGPASGTFAAADSERGADLLSTLQDPEVKAILCARGGYGCIHLLPQIPSRLLKESPKWIIGFSDVSALHAFWQHHGVASIHASMARHLAEFPLSDPSTVQLLDMLTSSPADGKEFLIEAGAHPLNTLGHAQGRLLGGNLAVLNGLSATPYDMLVPCGDHERRILFIEDIAEPIYKVERVLTRLWMAGTLSGIEALCVGAFTEYRGDRNFSDMESMIRSRLDQWGLDSLPVAFGLPIGHIDGNHPVIEGCMASLDISKEGTRIAMRME